jgi:hypothetical protein
VGYLGLGGYSDGGDVQLPSNSSSITSKFFFDLQNFFNLTFYFIERQSKF